MAAYTITVIETEGNVVATGIGSINTAGLPPPTISNTRPLTRGTDALLYIGGTTNPGGSAMNLFNSGVVGPASFGTAVTIQYASSASGDFVGILGDTSRMFVPLGYSSQAPLSSQATWNDTTIAGLGLTPGTYTWTWGAGATADSFTVQIGPPPEVVVTPAAPIPTLSEWGLIVTSALIGLYGLGRMRRRA